LAQFVYLSVGELRHNCFQAYVMVACILYVADEKTPWTPYKDGRDFAQTRQQSHHAEISGPWLVLTLFMPGVCRPALFLFATHCDAPPDLSFASPRTHVNRHFRMGWITPTST